MIFGRAGVWQMNKHRERTKLSSSKSERAAAITDNKALSVMSSNDFFSGTLSLHPVVSGANEALALGGWQAIS